MSLKNVSGFGCLSDSVSRAIDVRPVGTLSVAAASPVLCRGLNTTLTVTSATAGLTYTWTASTGGTFAGATITVSPTATTTYTVTGTTADGVCNTQASSTVTVTSPPVANAGPAAASARALRPYSARRL